MDVNLIQQIVIIFPVIMFAVSFHETAHAYVAYKLGDSTAYDAGRVTLNPIKHIDLFGTILLPLLLAFGGAPIFGYAKPVPVYVANLRNPWRDRMLVSAAGPISNILLFIVSTLLYYLYMFFMSDSFLSSNLLAMLGVRVLIYCIQINLFLAVFNMMPLPPLDGSKILQYFLSPEKARILESIEPYGFFIILALLYLNIIDLIFYPFISFLNFIIRIGFNF